MMTLAEMIYQHVKTMPEGEAQEVLNFIKFLEFKRGKNSLSNEITQRAIQEVEAGGGRCFQNTHDLFRDLNDD